VKRIVWTCDRCGVTTEAPREIVTVEDWGCAVERGMAGKASGWREFMRAETVEDVCPRCVSDLERADQLLAEVEADHIFSTSGEDMA
jgi:hypothetical protein